MNGHPGVFLDLFYYSQWIQDNYERIFTADPYALTSDSDKTSDYRVFNEGSVNLKIKFKPSGDEVQERKCMGHLIADNVILTSSMCCENFLEVSVIDSDGGTNGQNINTGKNVNKAGHLNNSVYGKSKSYQMCKWGQKKNGDCKKKGTGRRRREEETDSSNMICVIRLPYKIEFESSSKQPSKDCFKMNYCKINLDLFNHFYKLRQF